nr:MULTISPECIES: AraC family transcriptional regulator [unclassified Pseudomonas]
MIALPRGFTHPERGTDADPSALFDSTAGVGPGGAGGAGGAVSRAAGGTAERQGRDLERVDRARRLLETRPEHDWTIEPLEQCVELNTRKLKEGFRQLHDSSVYGYLQRVRIERAAGLLGGRCSVNEVAPAAPIAI